MRTMGLTEVDLGRGGGPGEVTRGPRRPYVAAGFALFALISCNNVAGTLYAGYADDFGFSPLVLMLIFATYLIALVPVLLLFGSVSDSLGRRWVVIVGLGLALLSTISFIVATSVFELFLGRALQGAAVGVCTGALTAAAVEHQPYGDRRRASLVTTVAVLVSPAVSLVFTGGVVQAGAAREVPWIVSGATLMVAAVLALSISNVRSSVWRPRRPAVPAEVRGPFFLAAAGAIVGWAVGGIAASILPSYIARSLDTKNLLLIGAITGLYFLSCGVGQVLVRKIHSRRAMFIGIISIVPGLALLIVTGATGSIVLLVLSAVFTGAGQGIMFFATIDEVNRIAPVDRRAETISAYYVLAYGGSAFFAVGTGLLATAWRLVPAVNVFALATIAATLALAVAVRRTAAPA